MKTLGTVKAVLTGKTQPYAHGTTSAIDKQIQLGRQFADVEGFTNDEQADRRVHGGPDKAIHIYPFEHYQRWRNDLGEKTLFENPGAFGENISCEGLDESMVCLHDKFQIGSAVVQITQGRMPCWKLNVRCDEPDMSLRFQNSLRTGWYFAVLTPGKIGAGDEITLLERPYPDWSVARIAEVFFSGSLDQTELKAMLKLPLKPAWVKMIERRLESGEVEDWSGRLFG